MHGILKNHAVKLGCILILLGCFYEAEATLKTTFVEDICRFHSSYLMDLRYEKSGILIASPFYSSINCTITLAPKPGHSMVLSIYRYDVEPGDILMIEDSDRYKIGLIGNRDFPDERKSIISDGKINIYYKKIDNDLNSRKQGFQFTYTQVRDAPCSLTEFRCRNQKCIPKELACNGHNHCGDNSNQKKCVPKDDKNYEPFPSRIPPGVSAKITALIGVVVGSIVLLAIIITLIVLIVRQAKARKANKAKQETHPNTPRHIGLQATASTAPGNQAQSPTVPNNNVSPQAHSRPTVFTQIRRSLRLHKSPQVEEIPKQQKSPEPFHVPSMYPSLDQLPSAPGYDGADNASYERDH